MYDGRTRLANDVAEEIRKHYPNELIDVPIPRAVRVSEAPSYGQTVMTYDPGSSGADAYARVAREIARRVRPRSQVLRLGNDRKARWFREKS